MEKGKKTEKLKQLLPMVFFILLGAACGLLFIRYIEEAGRDQSFGEFLLSLGFLIVWMSLAMYLQIVIHEAGHLVFGLLTGYRFSSFRVGSFIWIKQGGKLKLRRLSLVGTGGQCLLIPPELTDQGFPYILYNLGGSLFNLISAALFAGALLLCKGQPLLSLMFLMLTLIGIAYALINGIPMRLGTVDNDGYNALSLGKSPEALRAFWIQMKANEQVAAGVRLKDMPKEWFAMPSEDAMQNSMTAVLAVLCCNRLMDEMRFKEAREKIEELLEMKTAIVGLHRNLLIADLIYCELTGENRPDFLESVLTPDQKKFMKMMKAFPTVLRTEYAYALLAQKDGQKAAEWKNLFEKNAKKYPHPSEIESERELMAYAEKIAQGGL